MIGDSVDILRHVGKMGRRRNSPRCVVGTHAFSYTEKRTSPIGTLTAKCAFSLAIRKRPLLLTPATAAMGLRALKHTDAPYAVNFSRCNLQIASDCTFPGDQNLGEFAVTDFKNNPYYNVTFVRRRRAHLFSKSKITQSTPLVCARGAVTLKRHLSASGYYVQFLRQRLRRCHLPLQGRQIDTTWLPLFSKGSWRACATEGIKA